MCGRAYHTYTAEELEMRYLNRKPIKLPSFSANFNMAPTQECPVVHLTPSGERQIDLWTWGLIPSWSPEFKTKLSTINAKAETIFESKLYKGPILRRRCIVPLSGFIEWQAQGEKAPKRPYKIFLKDVPIMSMAGIWETWHPGDPDERHSFSILTTEANTFMQKLHHRMPVILDRNDEDAWLDLTIQDPARIAKLLKPCPAAWLEATEISTAINSPKNNRPDVLDAVSG
jgi:putative SOS response-associated peptidase YedK